MILPGSAKHNEYTHADFYKLRRFLRARSYDVEKATAMWLDHMRWCEQWQVCARYGLLGGGLSHTAWTRN